MSLIFNIGGEKSGNESWKWPTDGVRRSPASCFDTPAGHADAFAPQHDSALQKAVTLRKMACRIGLRRSEFAVCLEGRHLRASCFETLTLTSNKGFLAGSPSA